MGRFTHTTANTEWFLVADGSVCMLAALEFSLSAAEINLSTSRLCTKKIQSNLLHHMMKSTWEICSWVYNYGQLLWVSQCCNQRLVTVGENQLIIFPLLRVLHCAVHIRSVSFIQSLRRILELLCRRWAVEQQGDWRPLIWLWDGHASWFAAASPADVQIKSNRECDTRWHHRPEGLMLWFPG